jgi:glycosyltransferase involved in cell wall biosynthesis
MTEQIPELIRSLEAFIEEVGTPIDLIISHYWDAAVVGEGYRQLANCQIPHIWVPHSLGAIKKRNVSSEKWEGLRIDERLAVERELVRELDGIVSTSPIIRESLEEDYAFSGLMPFLPPCVDPKYFHPREVPKDDDVWAFLSEHAGISSEAIRRSKIITEISRTDWTKRKDVLIKAFAQLQTEIPESFLIVSIDESQEELAAELYNLLDELGVRDRTATLGSVWDILPTLYAISDVYCTASVMEGFGMSVQEAAATGVPAVTSHLVPFATKYLLGKTRDDLSLDEPGDKVVIGDGAIVVQADNVDKFTEALTTLLMDEDLCKGMGESAYQITIPYFTWETRTRAFLEEIGMVSPGGG